MSPSDRSTQSLQLVQGGDVLEIAASSDRGTVRQENQDAWRIVTLGAERGCALLVADGMGGHAGGREAAAAAVTAAEHVLSAAEDAFVALDPSFQAADEAVLETRRGGGVQGTTMVAAVIRARAIRIGNVGDSRAYLLRDGEGAQLTTDHSAIEEQIHAGVISRSDAATAPGRNLLTRAVTGEGAAPDFFDATMDDGAVLVLCSDGLWGWLDVAQLSRLLTGPAALGSLVEHACDAALAAGSTDNVTIVACRLGAGTPTLI